MCLQGCRRGAKPPFLEIADFPAIFDFPQAF
jgi:hypothetical protein